MRTTWWGFETRDRVLFPATASPTATITRIITAASSPRGDLARPAGHHARCFPDLALWWTKWADMRNYCARLDVLMDRLQVKTVCADAPASSSPTSAKTMPKVRKACCSLGSSAAERGTNEAKFKTADSGGRDGVNLSTWSSLSLLPLPSLPAEAKAALKATREAKKYRELALSIVDASPHPTSLTRRPARAGGGKPCLHRAALISDLTMSNSPRF